MILVGDAVQRLRELPDESVNLTIFSPPYDAIRDYDDKPIFSLFGIGLELLRVTADGGVCAVVLGDGTVDGAKTLTTFTTAVDWCHGIGWRMFETCVYRRPGRPGAWWNRRFRVDHEYILIFFKGKRVRYFDKEHLKIPSLTAGKKWGGTYRTTSGKLEKYAERVTADTKCRGTVWDYASSNSEGNKTKLTHPATMPDKLAADLIQTFTLPGDLVCDPMGGSGTTVVQAAKLGRRYLYIDISETYADIARTRLANETTNDAGREGSNASAPSSEARQEPASNGRNPSDPSDEAGSVPMGAGNQ